MSVALVETRPGHTARAAGAASETSSDEILLERIANGDQIAMRMLYARHHVAVYRFVLCTISDATAAEALVSEVFFEVWRQAPRLRMRSVNAGISMSTWLLVIARGKALAIRSDRAGAQRRGEFAHEFAAGTAGRRNGRVLPKRDRGALLRRALARLSAEQREVIDLVYYHRKSVAEVAAIVGVPDVTVQARMLDARRRLAELIRAA